MGVSDKDVVAPVAGNGALDVEEVANRIHLRAWREQISCGGREEAARGCAGWQRQGAGTRAPAKGAALTIFP